MVQTKGRKKEYSRIYMREYMRKRREKHKETRIEEEIKKGNLNFGLKPLREFVSFENWVPDEGTEKTFPNWIRAKIAWSKNWAKDEPEEPELKPDNRNYSVREQDFKMDIKSLSDEPQSPSEQESGFGANMWHDTRDPRQPKKKSNQDRLRDEFGDERTQT